MRKSLGKVITCVGPLLIINLAIGHLSLNGLTGREHRRGFRLAAALTAQPIKPLWEKAFVRGKKGHLVWLAPQSPSREGWRAVFI